MKRRANGEGSVYWSTSYDRYVGESEVAGKRKKVYGPRGDKSKAARLGVSERLRKYIGRRGSRNEGERLDAFVDRWIETAPIRSKTKQFYEWLSRTHLAPLSAMKIADIEPVDVRRHVDGLDVGDRTRQAVYGLLHTVLAEAVNLDLISRNAAENVKRPRVQRKELRVLLPDEVSILLRAAVGNRLHAMIVLALTTTMGPGELFGLRRRDVHLSERYLVVNADLVESAPHGYRPTIEPPKTAKRRRRIDLPQSAVDALRERLKLCLVEGSGEFVFTSPEGRPMRLSNLHRRWWKPLLERAAMMAAEHGLSFPTNVRMYDLRHTANALMAAKNIPIQAASDRMGHSSIKTTVDVYGHLYASRQREVADQIDELFRNLTHAFPHDVSQETSGQ